MDRCRCEDYAEAVRGLRFYTVGTHRPDIIDNYDRSRFVTTWVRHGIDFEDLKFTKPKAFNAVPLEDNEYQLSKEAKKIEQMWCPYMTPVKRG